MSAENIKLNLKAVENAFVTAHIVRIWVKNCLESHNADAVDLFAVSEIYSLFLIELFGFRFSGDFQFTSVIGHSGLKRLHQATQATPNRPMKEVLQH